MSKINELRKKAAEAARKRDWNNSVRLYEKVCEIDSNNPGFRNELGDVFLKMGEGDRALEAFERAAEAYRGVGLHNNAVAVYKKILRHDPGHLDALWGLGELKGQQGLDTDAVSHYIEYLGRADSIVGSQRQKFVNHCLLLVERYDDDLQMLSRVESIFEKWEQGEDHARVLIQKARLARTEGQDELIEKYIARAREVFSELDLLDDYVELQKEIGGGAASAAHDVEDIDDAGDDYELGNASGEIELDENADQQVRVRPTGEIDLGFDLEAGRADSGAAAAPESEAPAARQRKVEPGVIDIGDSREPEVSPAPPAEPVAEQRPQPKAPAAREETDPAVDGSVNLLDELLSDAGFDMQADESGQVDTIREDVGAQIAGNIAADDYPGQYEVGLVYMDMGLYENAGEAFGRAARGPQLRLKALEMFGNCLRQLGRNADALVAYQEGLRTPGHPDRFYLGLHYEIGACLEELGQLEEALQHFERAAAIDAAFLDVKQRVQQLLSTGSS